MIRFRVFSLSLVFIFVFLASCSCGVENNPKAIPSTLSFAIVADAHLKISSADDCARNLVDAVSKINQKNPSFSVMLGDMINGFSPEKVYDAEWKNLKNILSSLDAPYYLVRGNHENIQNWTNDQDVAKWLKVTGYKNNNYSFDNGNFHFIVLDTNNITDEQRTWLNLDLGATGKKTVVFSHIPVTTFVGESWLLDDPATRAVLENYKDKILCVFSGHAHMNLYRELNGIKYYSICNSYQDASWSMVTVYTSGDVEIRGFGDCETYYPDSSVYLAENYMYHNTIAIDTSLFPPDVSDYPVKIQLDDGNFDFSKAQPDGDDIRFTDNSGKILDYELEHWKNGDAVLWVKIPRKDFTQSQTDINIYYGNPAAGDAENPRDVWGKKEIIDHFADIQYMSGWVLSSISGSNVGVKTVRNTVKYPVAGDRYSVTYDPPGTWDFSGKGEELVWWLRSSIGQTDLRTSRVYLYDVNGNYRYWNIKHQPNIWKKVVLELDGGTASATPPDMSQITSLSWEVTAAGSVAINQDFSSCYTYTGYNIVLHFDEGSGDTVRNVTALGDYTEPGKIMHGAWLKNTLEFDGKSTAVVFPDGDEFNSFENGYTADAYVQSNLVSGDRVIASLQADDQTGVALRMESVDMRPEFTVSNGVKATKVFSIVLPPENYTYIADTIDKRTMVAYMNAKPGQDAAAQIPIPYIDDGFYLGSSPDHDSYWKGSIDEFRWTSEPHSPAYINLENINMRGGLVKSITSSK